MVVGSVGVQGTRRKRVRERPGMPTKPYRGPGPTGMHGQSCAGPANSTSEAMLADTEHQQPARAQPRVIATYAPDTKLQLVCAPTIKNSSVALPTLPCAHQAPPVPRPLNLALPLSYTASLSYASARGNSSCPSSYQGNDWGEGNAREMRGCSLLPPSQRVEVPQLPRPNNASVSSTGHSGLRRGRLRGMVPWRQADVCRVRLRSGLASTSHVGVRMHAACG